MTAIIDNQVVSCLAEMERLREKIKALNKEKQERAVTKKKKIRDPEPNMAVLESLFGTYNESEVFDKNAEEANRIHDIWIRRSDMPGTERGKYAEVTANYLKYYEKNRGSYKKKRPVPTPSPFIKDFIEATHNLFQIQQKRIDELEIKLQAQHHTPRQLEYMAHKRASRFKAHLAEKIHTGSPDTYQGCGGSCAICLKDMTSGEMCYKLNTGGMEHVFHRVCGEQQM